MAAEKKKIEQEVEKGVDRRMHALGLGGRTHDTPGELGGAHIERAWHREQDSHNQRDTSNQTWVEALGGFA